MTVRPIFRKAARLEFDEAVTWYEGQRDGLGSEFVLEIDRAVQHACEAPKQFPTALRDVRQIRVTRFPYSIFFRLKNDRLVVLAVFHARRDPLVWRERA